MGARVSGGGRGEAVLGRFELESKNMFRGFHSGISRCYASPPRCTDRPLPTAGGGGRHVSGLMRTDRASHPITPASPRGTGRLAVTSAGLLSSLIAFWGAAGVMDEGLEWEKRALGRRAVWLSLPPIT